MMDTSIAIITLSEAGARVAHRLADAMPGATVYVHEGAHNGKAPNASDTALNASKEPQESVRTFSRMADLTRELFPRVRALIYIAPTGAVVRAIAPCVGHKTTDPAVVVVDVGARWAISLLSGHEGGANALAVRVGNILSAEPIVTTTSEAARRIIVGVGCRRGVSADRIVAAVDASLATADVSRADVRLIASADIKADEAGLILAAEQLGVPLRVISSDEIRGCTREFGRSEFVQDKVNLPAVAEPAALLAGRRTRLLLPRQTFEGVTVALAAEDCWSLG